MATLTQREGALFEPSPRFRHQAIAIGHQVYQYGGYSSRAEPSRQMGVFNQLTEEWRSTTTTGLSPPGVIHGGTVFLHGDVFHYGGSDGRTYYGGLYRLQAADLRWKCVDSCNGDGAPMKKTGCRIVIVGDNSVGVLGGYGYPQASLQPGSTFIKDDDFSMHGRGYTNEFHVFNLIPGTWSSPTLTGDRPPPSCDFTLVNITKHRAVYFGGYLGEKKGLTNALYIIDFKAMVCTKIEPHEGELWPVARDSASHAACCLNYGDESPQLLITCGRDRGNKVLNDAWIWDFSSRKWKELTLPAGMQPRFFHSATAITLSPGLVEVTMFGGCPEWPKNPKMYDDFTKLADTTIMRFEAIDCPSSDGRSSTKEYVLVDVATNHQRGTSERLAEKMLRISSKANEVIAQADTKIQAALAQAHQADEHAYLVVQQANGRSQRLEQQLQISNHRAHEAEVRLQQANQKISQAEGQAHDLAQQLQRAEEQVHEANQLVEQANQRARDAEAARDEAVQRALQVRNPPLQDTHWVIERDEIVLTDQELGRGGWGEVRVANFRGSRVAAKSLFQQISPFYRMSFIREMNMAARLRHPNLVQFIGATLDREAVILIELMTTSLRAVLEQGPIGQAQIVSISLDVARALNYIHEMKPDPMIHRDISSANVLLDPLPNNHWKAKVSDYGSVNLLQQLQTVGPGSPVYAAPEANFPAQQSPKMDIFSFGIVLIEMVTDTFPDPALRDYLIASIEQPRYVALIRRCLDREKDNRPSANELIAELNE